MSEQKNPQEFMNQLLAKMAEFAASDLHLKVGYAPYYRVAGHLQKIKVPPLENSEFVEAMLQQFDQDFADGWHTNTTQAIQAL